MVAPLIGAVAPLSEPGDHGLGFEVVLERVVAHFPAPARLLVAAERHRRVEHAVAVDPHRAGAQAVGGAVRLVDVARPDPRRQAVARLVAAVNYVLLGTEGNRDHHWSEDLLAYDLHFG